MILVLAGLRPDLGLSGTGWAAALCIGAGCTAPPPSWWRSAAVRSGDRPTGRAVRRASRRRPSGSPRRPTPSSCGVAAVSVARWSGHHRTGRRADRLAVAGGMAFAACLLLSYGLVLVVVVPVVVAWRGPRVRPLVVVGVVATAVLAAFGLIGFWWPARPARHPPPVRRAPRLATVLVLRARQPLGLGARPGPGHGGRAVRCRSATDPSPLLVGGRRPRRHWSPTSAASPRAKSSASGCRSPYGCWPLARRCGPTDRHPGRRPVTERRVQGWLALQAASAIALVSLVRTQW